MPTVDAFESSTPEQKLSEDAQGKFDYAQVEEALKHVDVGGLEMVENIYARCAKKHFRALMGNDVHLNIDESPPAHAIFVVGLDMVVQPGFIQLGRLPELTKAMAATITALRLGEPVVLDGALHVRVIEVGTNIYKFSLKQRWGLR